MSSKERKGNLNHAEEILSEVWPEFEGPFKALINEAVRSGAIRGVRQALSDIDGEDKEGVRGGLRQALADLKAL